jgi:hypothetical protein
VIKEGSCFGLGKCRAKGEDRENFTKKKKIAQPKNQIKPKLHFKNVFYFILAIRNGASLFGGKYFYTLFIQ